MSVQLIRQYHTKVTNPVQRHPQRDHPAQAPRPHHCAKFNTCQFLDYKKQVIDLLQRVCTASVETMKIIEQMPGE